MSERDPYSGKTLAQAQGRWEEVERDLEILHKRKDRWIEWRDKIRSQGYEPDYEDWDEWNLQIGRLIDEQWQLEMFLIENEAPGWTST